MASQITSLTIVYSNAYSGTDQRKHQSSASLAFVRGIHRWPVNSLHKRPVTWKIFPFGDVIMSPRYISVLNGNISLRSVKVSNIRVWPNELDSWSSFHYAKNISRRQMGWFKVYHFEFCYREYWMLQNRNQDNIKTPGFISNVFFPALTVADKNRHH